MNELEAQAIMNAEGKAFAPLRCLRCGHQWQRRKSGEARVQACPGCNSRVWDGPKVAQCICEDLGGKRGEIIQCRYCFPIRQQVKENKENV